ncbi:MAG: ABC transporter permease [Desulfobacteraceae bacterium]|nr:ABC transporter permease [Desulfobacteraceae bacterium]MBC2750896.1 ABC transporter permease [Desulfobacteraceae bacterium]
MLKRHLRRALQDMRSNRMLSLVTISTFALSILIVSSAMLFFVNMGDIMDGWRQGIRVMAYLQEGLNATDRSTLKVRMESLYGVQQADFVPKAQALERLRTQMGRQTSILDNLDSNPLPDAFEIQMIAASQSWDKVEQLATALEKLEGVSEVEYGQRWIKRIINIFNLFQLTGTVMGALFFMAAVFIVGNTVRLVLYSRREEVEIMRLVGATEQFILAPFYFQSLIQAALGGIIGLAALFMMYMLIQSRITTDMATAFFQPRFLSPLTLLGIVGCGMLVGWLGCHLSVKQYVKA